MSTISNKLSPAQIDHTIKQGVFAFIAVITFRAAVGIVLTIIHSQD